MRLLRLSTLLVGLVNVSQSYHHSSNPVRPCRLDENRQEAAEYVAIERSSDLAALQLRGGSEKAGKKKRKRRKKSGTKQKEKIEKAEEDYNREEDDPEEQLSETDATLQSLGISIGTATVHYSVNKETDEDEQQAITTLSQYFLQNHAHLYGPQCFCSFLAVLSGMAALASNKTGQVLELTKRACVCAALKHATGLFAAAFVAGSGVSQIGLHKTRGKVKRLIRDPVSQYLFYALLMMVWIPSASSVAGGQTRPTWWANVGFFKACVLSPVLMREVVHMLWVISDVARISEFDGNIIYSSAATMVNAAMSLLLGADAWKQLDNRQKLLAKLVSRASLAAELVTGAIILADASRTFVSFALSSSARAPMSDVLRSVFCARLYILFMSVRRKRITELGDSIRGGALDVPDIVLDALLEPRKAMGLPCHQNAEKQGVGSLLLDALTS